jgi:hypothetical protein
VAPVTGYIKLWRQMAEHGHLNMPDNALKVFIYLMFRAGREARPKLGLDEGEAWVSYEDIQESCSERVDLDGREVDRTMSRSTVAKILRFLEAPEQGYIKRVKSGLGLGMKIKVLNYQKLQKIACTSESSQIELGSELGIEHKQEVTKNHKEDIPPYSPPVLDVTASEREILAVLNAIPNYPFDYTVDLRHIRALVVDFPTVDLLEEAKSYATWLLGKSLKAKSNPRLQFRNWCKNAIRFREKARPASRQPEPKSWATLRKLAEEAREDD